MKILRFTYFYYLIVFYLNLYICASEVCGNTDETDGQAQFLIFAVSSLNKYMSTYYIDN